MKLKHTLSLLSLATCAALSTSAFAQSTITFNGLIEDSACGSVTVDGGATVTLPTQSASSFSAAGTRQGGTPFKVTVNNCQPTTGTFAVAFSHTDADSATGYLTNIGVAGVAYELTNTSDAHIDFYQNAPSPNSAPHANTPTGGPGSAGPYELNYKIWYVSTAATVGTGATTKTATMTVTYQ